MKTSGKILYYPIFPDADIPGADQRQDVLKWIESSLIPVTDSEDKANAYLVVGGDGFFMATARQAQNMPIIGINRGTRGFLLNEINSPNQLPVNFEEFNFVTVELMSVTYYTRDNKSQKFLAFNDVFCGGNIADFITFNIEGSLNGFPNRTNIKGNGVIVTTPQGSTGFMLNAIGSSAVLPLSSKIWMIGGVATGPYPNDIVTPQKIIIEVSSRNPVDGYADGYAQEVKNIASAVITPSDHKVTIGFIKGIDFEARRRIMAQRMERGEEV